MNHSKSGPFKNRTNIDHSTSGHVQISDPHCDAQIQIPFFYLSKVTLKNSGICIDCLRKIAPSLALASKILMNLHLDRDSRRIEKCLEMAEMKNKTVIL